MDCTFMNYTLSLTSSNSICSQYMFSILILK